MLSKREITNSKILVTGGAGFIGSNICEVLLAQNNEVICLDNFSTGKRENIEPFLELSNFRLIGRDIRDYDTCVTAVNGVNYVLHQAALGSVPRSIDDPITTNSVNISGFLNILTAAKEAKVKRFVYAASSSTYGDHPDLPKVEDRIGNPLSPYAVTKLVNEYYAKVFSELYGIETVGLRYFNVFGRRQDPDGAYAAAIPKFVKALVNYESHFINGDGNQSRDFTYIDNVIQANQLAALCDHDLALNTVYNVAYGSRCSLNKLLELLKTLLSDFDAKIADVEIKYGPERIGDIKHSLASIEKAKSILGYDPKYDIEKGLQEAINWYWNNLR